MSYVINFFFLIFFSNLLFVRFRFFLFPKFLPQLFGILIIFALETITTD